MSRDSLLLPLTQNEAGLRALQSYIANAVREADDSYAAIARQAILEEDPRRLQNAALIKYGVAAGLRELQAALDELVIRHTEG